MLHLDDDDITQQNKHNSQAKREKHKQRHVQRLPKRPRTLNVSQKRIYHQLRLIKYFNRNISY